MNEFAGGSLFPGLAVSLLQRHSDSDIIMDILNIFQILQGFENIFVSISSDFGLYLKYRV